jgi:Plasmid pRiA4b ORF-3-like protein
MATRTKTTGSLLQLKIELARIKPLIWRRVVVPETITLAKLHQVIQAVMGWSDCHLHQFEIGEWLYGIPDPDDPFGPPATSEARARLGKSLAGTTSFRYVYDFGDNWEHKIKVEKTFPPDACPVPLCIGGANACPPEDIGGPYGYPDFLDAVTNPTHPEHQAMLDWHGGPFDPTAVDSDAIDRRLQHIKL